MLNALIVVYRESFEALLIVGLLYSFLVRNDSSRKGFHALFWGAIAGLGLSAMLGLFVHRAESELEGFALEIFQIVMMIVAVLLMTHMCIWMRRHARALKSELEASAQEALSAGNYLSLAVLTMIAVGREGSETVIFLYGLLIEAVDQGQIGSFLTMSVAGLALGVVTWFVFQKGFQFFSQRAYFMVSSILLFLTAGSLLLSVSRKMIELDWIPLGRETAWDSAWILSDQSWLGSIVGIVTGYHTRPAIASLVLYASYWFVALGLYYRAGTESLPAPARS